MGRYRDESDEPLTEDDRRNIRKMLSDPLSFPDEFTGWLRGRTRITMEEAPPASAATTTDPGPWKVYDSTAHSNQNGRINGRCWQLDVPGVTQRLCGTAVNTSGPDRITRAWTNAYDATDEQFDIWRPGPYSSFDDTDPQGWAGSKLVLVGAADTIRICDYDGTNALDIYTSAGSAAAAPFWANNRTAQNRIYITDSGAVTAVRKAKFDGTDVLVYTTPTYPIQPSVQAGTNYIPASITQHWFPRVKGDARTLMLLSDGAYGYPGDLIDIEAGTRVLQLVTSNGAAASSNVFAGWSPDGKYVAWCGYDTTANTYELWIADIDTATAVQIPSTGAAYEYEFAWGPSSTQLLYVDGNGDIFVSDLTGDAEQVYDASGHGGFASQPQWFGDAITFIEDDGADQILYELNPYDGTATVIEASMEVSGGGGVCYTLSPNGSFVAYQKAVTASTVYDVWVARTSGLAA